MTARYSLLSVALLALGVIPFTGLPNVPAQDKEKEEPPKITEAARATLDVATAFRMADLGRKTKSPEALIAAARVIGTTKFTNLDLKDAKVESADSFEQVDALKMANGLIQEAVAIKSAQSDAVRQLAEAAQKDIASTDRGVPGGPRTIRGRLGQHDHRDTFHLTFRGGELAVISINNRSNRGDIDLYVYDENNRLVTQDRRTDDDASVAWTPHRTHRYRVVVHLYRGHGPEVRYTLTTN